MLLGAHCSTAGGAVNAVREGLELGCEAIQIFTRNQRQWTPKPLDPVGVADYRAAASEAGYDRHAVSHASYLINLAATDPVTEERSIAALTDEVQRCALLGVPLLCFHPGSHLGAGEDAGLERIATNLRTVLTRTRGERVTVLLENTAGQGTNLGHRLEHLAQIARRVRSRRVGVCIDTCHLFAAGYDFTTPEGHRETIAELDRTVGLDRIRAFHLNDSKHDCGSRKDRHENIGQGAIGEEPFGRWVRQPEFQGIPALLETPGGVDGFRRDLELLRRLRGRSPA